MAGSPLAASAALRLVLLLACCGAATAGPRWQADLQINPGALAMFGLALDSDAGLDPSPAIAGYQRLRLAGDGPADSVILQGGWTLRRGARAIDLGAARLRVDPRHNGVWLLDSAGRPRLAAEMPHRHPGAGLDWRFMDLRLLPEAATALGEPALSGLLIGSLDLRGPAIDEAKGDTVCPAPPTVWPGAGLPADIALIDLPAVSALRCSGCSSASSDGRVVIAPSARLLNVGASDVPWNSKFRAPGPPYDNDQHPYLVWSLYRIDADGSLHPLGSSGVKHAFFAQNDLCGCSGGYVLYRGCSDLYSASTNDVSGFLGPREEIDARSGRWGRCGSVFDRDCDGIQDSGAGAPDLYARRLVVAESELLASLHPGARWWIEAWYVVRDDPTPDNGFAHREVVPTKIGSGWVFPFATGSVPLGGPALDAWVDPNQPTAEASSQRIALADGNLRLAVQVRPGMRGWHYRYALLNLDHGDARFSGSEPGQLRLDALHGALGLRFPNPRCAARAPGWRDGDGDPGNDWQADAGEPLALAAGDPAGLGWGRAGVIEFDSASPAVQGLVDLVLGDGRTVAVATLLPEPAGCRFRGGFEDTAE